MHFKIDWASLIVESKLIVFVLLYVVLEGNFPSTSPREAYIWRGDLTQGFLRYEFGGLIFGIYGMWILGLKGLKSFRNVNATRRKSTILSDLER